jgi:hypothetical protein
MPQDRTKIRAVSVLLCCGSINGPWRGYPLSRIMQYISFVASSHNAVATIHAPVELPMVHCAMRVESCSLLHWPLCPKLQTLSSARSDPILTNAVLCIPSNESFERPLDR